MDQLLGALNQLTQALQGLTSAIQSIDPATAATVLAPRPAAGGGGSEAAAETEAGGGRVGTASALVLAELRDMLGDNVTFAVAPEGSSSPPPEPPLQYRVLQRVQSLRFQYPECSRSQRLETGEPCTWCRTSSKVAAHRRNNATCRCYTCRSFREIEGQGCEWDRRKTEEPVEPATTPVTEEQERIIYHVE